MKQLFLPFIFLSFFINQQGQAQSIDCAYPIIFIHGFTGSDASFDDIYTDPEFVACYGGLTDVFHSVLNANDQTNIWGNDGVAGTTDDDVLVTFNNETNDLAPGCVYAINFNNFWNEDENNPEIDIHGCGSPGFTESDGNESAIIKGGYALGKMIEKVLAANPDKDKVILVGFSMGGLTSREYLQRTENGNPRWWVDPLAPDGHKVAKLITASTPHRGSNFFGNPWPLTGDPQADTRDELPDPASEATRDLRYSFATGCGFLGLGSCPGAYLFGGDEDDLWGYWNEDVDVDGDETSIVVGINEAGSSDPWDGTRDNPSMPLPTNIRYTYITSDIFLDDGDGVVSLDRQWLFSGSTPVPSDGVGYRLTDTTLTDYSHLNVNSDPNVIIRGLDEGDYPLFAFKVQMNNMMGGLVQERSRNTPEGLWSTDPDWFKVDIPSIAAGVLNIAFNPHPLLSGQIDFFTTSPGNYEEMSVSGNHQTLFNPGASTIVLAIPETDYTAGTTHYFRVIHNGINPTDWHMHYDFELTQNTPLPVELVSFSGKIQEDYVALNWVTYSEFNSRVFEIMRSFNGIDFQTIGTVDAAGNSIEAIDYKFLDKDPFLGNNYYRLKQIDLDGKVNYSNIIYLYFEQDMIEVHKVFPNPAHDIITVDYFNFANKPTSFNIYNMVGQLLQTEQVNSEQGNNSSQVDIRRLSRGLYILEIQQGKFKEQVRIVKQ